MTTSPFTDHQRRAIAAEGNVLIVAGAGTGKTRTLVERCLARVCDATNPVSLDAILMVTFTESAAAEMRKRLREELEKRAAAERENSWLAEQSALLDTARISTLHSFCLQLVREHFHELGLDPQLTVMPEQQARLLANEALDRLLQRNYAGGTTVARAVQQLILEYGGGRDQPIRELVLRLHHYTQTLRAPNDWFRDQMASFQQPRPELWQRRLRECFDPWRKSWLPILQSQPDENVNARRCAACLGRLPDDPMRHQIASALSDVLAADQAWPDRKKGVFRGPIEAFFDEAGFLEPLAAVNNDVDPLAQEWEWVRPQMTALLQLAQEFSAEFARAKRDLAVLDFHDLEQFALQLLWDRAADRPAGVASYWRQKLKLLFVDEYQDINEAQDTILRALGREGDQANRFLVGDVKQSIYRFRLANPRIFQRYAAEWKRTGGPGQVIALSDNFRSHQSILNFVNALFAGLMRKEVGGVDYDEVQRLRFAAPDQRKYFSAAGSAEERGGTPAASAADAKSAPPEGVCDDLVPRVELLLRWTVGEETDSEDNNQDSGWGNLSNAEKEARLVALRLRELKERAFLIRDQDQFRPVEWRDMAILLRSPRSRTESYAKVFESQNIPFTAGRGGFFASLEITDLLSLLQLLDNPLQDRPLLAVLRSPLAGLSLDELAAIRLGSRRGHLWTALQRCQRGDSNVEPAGSSPVVAAAATRQRVGLFLRRFAAWRGLARQASLSQCLEAVLDQTHYESWLLAQSRGEQRRANVQRLLAVTRQFDQYQRQGLFRFLRFVEAQQEAQIEMEPASGISENTVRFMSIHQSKGLEFPVVVVADLGRRFNFDELKERVILDEEMGLCPKVKPPHAGQFYPSLTYWLARQRQKREAVGEEMRLLYVATTRACDKLILVGTETRKTFLQWVGGTNGSLESRHVLEARSCLEWLGRWLPGAAGQADWAQSGKALLLAWTIYEENDPRLLDRRTIAGEASDSHPATDPRAVDPARREALRQRLDWRYPHEAATREPAKTSISGLRRRFRDETDDEARTGFQASSFMVRVPLDTPTGGRRFSLSNPMAEGRGKGESGPKSDVERVLTGAEIGTAHHTFLELVSLDRVGSVRELEAEAARLRGGPALSEAESDALDLTAVAAFWQSDVGKQILARRDSVHREIPFTARFTSQDLAQLNLLKDAPELADDFFVVQGFVDLAVILPDQIWLLDFKTDAVAGPELEAKQADYGRQLKLYGLALHRIYQRPVTASWLHFLALRRTVPVTPAR